MTEPVLDEADLAGKKARYEALRTLLITLLVGIVLLSLIVLLWQAQQIRQNQRIIEGLARDSATQAGQVADLLDRQKKADANRDRLIDSAIKRISAEQRRGLVAHDKATQDFLARNYGLLSREVYGKGNRENQAAKTVISTFIGPVPTRPAPTCHRLPNGKCRK